MSQVVRTVTPVAVLLAAVLFNTVAQEQAPSPRAAVVNGEAIPERALLGPLQRVPAEHKAVARQEILDHLIDAVLIDQHLVKLKINVSPQAVDERLKEIEKEVKAQKQDLKKILEELVMTDAEFRAQITSDLRWEAFVKSQTSDEVLAELFKKNRDWFDGSLVRARHVLVGVGPDADAKTRETAKAKLVGIKRAVEEKVAAELSKASPPADAVAREQARVKVLTEVFSEAAKQSDCPSKKNGGDLGMFPRIGSMVEPFAKTAFALQPGQMSGIVETQFGYHLILVTARTPGKDIKFDDIKDDVREVYADRLRDELLPQLRKSAKIEVVGKAKP